VSLLLGIAIMVAPVLAIGLAACMAILVSRLLPKWLD